MQSLKVVSLVHQTVIEIEFPKTILHKSLWAPFHLPEPPFEVQAWEVMGPSHILHCFLYLWQSESVFGHLLIQSHPFFKPRPQHYTSTPVFHVLHLLQMFSYFLDHQKRYAPEALFEWCLVIQFKLVLHSLGTTQFIRFQRKYIVIFEQESVHLLSLV